MKRFIDGKGIFEIKVPITWKYSRKDEKVHTFYEYEIWKADPFQISIIHVKDENVKNKRNGQGQTFIFQLIIYVEQ